MLSTTDPQLGHLYQRVQREKSLMAILGPRQRKIGLPRRSCLTMVGTCGRLAEGQDDQLPGR